MYKAGDVVEVNLENIDAVGEAFFQYIIAKKAVKGATLVKLIGDLGAGKTTLTKIWARLLGVESDVSSPTFVIQKEYITTHKTFKKLVHIDAYRLEGDRDIENLKIDNVLNEDDTLVVVEWPELLFGNKDMVAIEIKIEHKDDDERLVYLD